MKYRVEIIINEQIERVTALYIDRESMPLWEKGLIQIKDIDGTLFNSNTHGELIFSFNNEPMIMGVTVEENNLPHSITQVFSVPGAVNRCHHTFIPIDNKTEWIMDVSFDFEQEHHIPEERFYQKTLESMMIFKDFVEGVKET